MRKAFIITGVVALILGCVSLGLSRAMDGLGLGRNLLALVFVAMGIAGLGTLILGLAACRGKGKPVADRGSRKGLRLTLGGISLAGALLLLVLGGWQGWAGAAGFGPPAESFDRHYRAILSASDNERTETASSHLSGMALDGMEMAHYRTLMLQGALMAGFGLLMVSVAVVLARPAMAKVSQGMPGASLPAPQLIAG